MGLLYALITVLAWGTWLAPSQNISFKNQQIKTFYVSAANLILSTIIFLLQPTANLTFSLFWPAFLGGLIWAVSGFLAFSATNRLGMARAFGIWTPINVAISIFWGALIFGEFLSVGPITLLLLSLSVLILIAGVLLIIFAKGTGQTNGSRQVFWVGLLSAIGAGLLWGTYFIPIKLTNASMWLLTFPMSLGIFVGSAVLVGLSRQKIFLQSPGEYVRVACTGVLWGLGNYGMLHIPADGDQ